MTSRGCTSRSTNSVAQVQRPSCTVIFRTPAFAQRASHDRLTLRGSIGVPDLVVKISLPPCHADPAVSLARVLCSGRYCLHRSLATTLLCRIGGTWPTWCTGVRTPPFAAHVWVEAEGHRVGEPQDTATYRTMLTVPPR